MPLKDLTIWKVQFPHSVLAVLQKFSFILDPVLIDLVPIFIIERSVELRYFLIVKGSFSLELVCLPLAVICDAVIRVVEYTSPIHFILLPLADVLAAFIVVECSFSMSHVIELGSLILAFEVGFRNILKFLAWLIVSVLNIISVILLANIAFSVVFITRIWKRQSIRVVWTAGDGVVNHSIGIRGCWVKGGSDLLLHYLFDILFGFDGFILFEAHIFHLHNILIALLH